MDATTEQYNIQSSNQAYIEPNVLELRLDTSDLLERIKVFLSGGRLTYTKDENGTVVSKFVKEGNPLCNDFGVQNIVAFLSMQINPATVQGNLDSTEIHAILESTRKGLAKNLLVNSTRYGMKREDRSFIILGIFNMLRLFISRTKDNEERNSYSTSLGARIGNLVSPQKKGLF